MFIGYITKDEFGRLQGYMHEESYFGIDHIHNRWDGKGKISLGVEFVIDN